MTAVHLKQCQPKSSQRVSVYLKNSRVKKGVQWTDKTDRNNVGEEREGFRCMTGIKKGRKRLRM
jgi:hypothetical protein